MSRKILEYEKLSRTGVSDDGTLLYNGNSLITIGELKAIIGACAPTDNYDVNRIILACSTMDGNDAIPLALPKDAKFMLYVNRDDSGTFTDLEIEDNSGELHPLEHGLNWIYWSSLDVSMNLYVNIGVLEDNFINPDDVIEFAFTSVTTSEASIALMTALYGIYDAENAISISFEQVEEAKEAAQEAKEMADVVIVCPHWGTEYTTKPSSYQQKFALQMTEAGADIIIGTHPHVVQPVEWIEAENGNRALCFYSLGNYVSTQKNPLCMLETMAWVSFRVTEDGISIEEEKTGVLPMVCHYTANPVRLESVYLLEDYTEEKAAAHGISSYGGVNLYLGDLQTWSQEVFGKNVLTAEQVLSQ